MTSQQQQRKLFQNPPIHTFNPVGSICVVTGGASGIGRALCIELGQCAGGAKHIVVVDLDLTKAQQVVEQDLPAGVGIAMQADCSVERDVRRVILQTEAECGAPIDAFFCNAGILSIGGIDVSNDEWDLIWKINVLQTVYVARHLIPRYQQRQRGLLVITASAAGLLSMPGALPYAVTKHAAVGIAEWLAFTYARQGIQVACLCPQAVQTDMIGDTDGGPAGLEGVLQPSDVAKATLAGIRRGQFLILPHGRVAGHMIGKAKDCDKWLAQMEKIHAMFGEEMLRSGSPKRAKL